jgi:DNA (cytosine-5)-methyltransferase 1
MTPTYGSLFSGVGGFDMGFDRAGYDCKWQVEWDKNCQQTLAHHWPGIPRHGDVQDVRGDQLEPVDVIIYGSPCQDLSVAGRRAGIEGGRSSMFFESVRIFKEMRDATNGTFPRLVVWENVPGALTSNNGEDFRAVLTALDDIGAVAQWWNVLDAQFFGIPQRRRRVFLVSVFDPAIAERAGTGQILAVGQGRRRNPAKVNQQREHAATVAGEGSHGVRAIGFNWANGGGYGDANPGLGITIEGTGPLSTSQVPAVAWIGS